MFRCLFDEADCKEAVGHGTRPATPTFYKCVIKTNVLIRASFVLFCFVVHSCLNYVPSQNQPNPNAEVTCELFGEWQTEDYKPPPAVDVSHSYTEFVVYST